MNDNANEQLINRFRDNVRKTLREKKNGSILQAGRPHEIFIRNGLPDQPITVSPAIIRKARKLKYNDHNVKQKDLERLPELVHNPVALLKSLTDSTSFVVVLDAKDDSNRPVIVAVKPKNGFNEITGIYGRDGFSDFITRTNEAGYVLSINKNKAIKSVVLPAVQFRRGATFDDYQEQLYQKRETMSSESTRIFQKNNPQNGLDTPASYEAENTNSKETKMADWSENKLRIYADKETREKILSECFDEGSIDFRKIIPIDNRFSREEHDEKWGTTSNAQNGKFSNPDDGPLEIDMETAWAPPLPIIKAIAEKYHCDTRLEYAIDGGIEGVATANWRDGKVLTEDKSKNILDEKEEQVEEQTPEKKEFKGEQSFYAQMSQFNTVSKALKEGTLSCLPGENGVADTEPAVNIVNGTNYHGANLLHLKEIQKEKEYPTAEWASFAAVKESGLPLLRGQRETVINISEKNRETGEWENKTAALFNVAQLASPDKFKQWAAAKNEEKIQEQIDWQRKNHNVNYTPQERKAPTKGPDVICSSTDPAVYLGQYLAAVSMRSKFTATPEQAAEFSKNLEGAMDVKMKNGLVNPFSFSKVCGQAAAVCKDTVQQARTQERAAPQQEQTQSRGRGM